uniref:Uncharacterized protein n=1 Tax=Anguilla anguilla TaxID=7936 RepID=A0A0E9U1S8_ANGAN
MISYSLSGWSVTVRLTAGQDERGTVCSGEFVPSDFFLGVEVPALSD